MAGSFSAKQRCVDSSNLSGPNTNHGVERQQALLSMGSPLLGPINRLKSGQPGLAAVAAAAAKEAALSGGIAAAVMAPEEAAAATAADLAQLWAGALPQTVGTGAPRVADSS
jgi:hypothetical protein